MKNKKKIFSVTDNNILFDDSMSEKDQDKSSTANSKKEILKIRESTSNIFIFLLSRKKILKKFEF